ncbi:MAG: hypothetical protein RMA76_18660 [Deltaproteobacteria bacterium]|jgi:hypothetical protein
MATTQNGIHLVGPGLLLTALLCGCPQTKAAPEPEPPKPVAQATPTSAMETPFSDAFPEVKVYTSQSFAHDRGNITRIESFWVDGKPAQGHYLAAVVEHRGGWSQKGERTEAAALATVKAFVEASNKVFGVNVVDGADENARPTTGGPSGYWITEHEGVRLVVAAQYYAYDGGNHGRQIARSVAGFRLDDGRQVALPSDWVPPAVK